MMIHMIMIIIMSFLDSHCISINTNNNFTSACVNDHDNYVDYFAGWPGDAALSHQFTLVFQ